MQKLERAREIDASRDRFAISSRDVCRDNRADLGCN